MFERYSEKSRRAIFFARYEASQYGNAYIETEHLLLGVLRERSRSIHQYFESPFSLDEIRREIESSLTIGTRIPTSVEVPLSEKVKHILNTSFEEAKRLSQSTVSTDHLLFAI